jgi:hypothetical protein
VLSETFEAEVRFQDHIKRVRRGFSGYSISAEDLYRYWEELEEFFGGRTQPTMSEFEIHSHGICLAALASNM